MTFSREVVDYGDTYEYLEGDKETYKYNESGQLIETIEYRSSVLGDIKYTYAYDTYGNRIEDYQEYPNNRKTTYVFDSSGNIVEQKYYESGSLVEKYISVYNDNGDNVGYTKYNKDGIASFKYSYTYSNVDSNGNWLKKVETKDNIANIVIERVIEYSF